MSQPLSLYLAWLLLGGLLAEAWYQRRAPWGLPAAVVYATTFAWYYVDPLLNAEEYSFLPLAVIEVSYCQIILFLVAFRLMVPLMVGRISRGAWEAIRHSAKVPLEPCFFAILSLWALLLTWGVVRVGGDVMAALFPIDSRSGGIQMWVRAAAEDAGPSGFLVATANYLYLLTCALFGVFVFFQRSLILKCFNLGLILLSWPFFLLSGTRNSFLAVLMPACFTYLLFVRSKIWMKVAILALVFLCVEAAMHTVNIYRDVGFRDFLTGESNPLNPHEEETRHLGLNMIQELCFINILASSKVIEPSYGSNYVAELFSLIPRAVWPGKPKLRNDYAKLRGFESDDGDIGTFATISTGFIGAGVLEFGRLFGPLAPAILMALWCGLLARWKLQSQSYLRACMLLAGFGITFNLGRDITSLTLWPVVFCYVLVRLGEKLLGRPVASALSSGQASLRAPAHVLGNGPSTGRGSGLVDETQRPLRVQS